MSWIDAQFYCMDNFNGNLATIQTDAERAEAVSLITNNAIWTGLYGSHQEGGFMWVDGTQCVALYVGCVGSDQWLNGKPKCTVPSKGGYPAVVFDPPHGPMRNDIDIEVELPFLCDITTIIIPDQTCDEIEETTQTLPGGSRRLIVEAQKEIVRRRLIFGCCICVFKGRTGKLDIDASCIGILPIHVIPENSAGAAFTGPSASTTYSADGFKIGGSIYKIDGSTCVEITCNAAAGTWRFKTCVNNLAAAIFGGGSARVVPAGTFANEPVVGAAALPVVA